jgi:hypothetical protein
MNAPDFHTRLTFREQAIVYIVTITASILICIMGVRYDVEIIFDVGALFLVLSFPLPIVPFVICMLLED